MSAVKRSKPERGRKNRSFRASDDEYTEILSLAQAITGSFAPLEARHIEPSLVVRAAIRVARRVEPEIFLAAIREELASDGVLQGAREP